ncbi:hypothetical protein U1Q18_047420, partial [Sarracenia purpurea var. burkii]
RLRRKADLLIVSSAELGSGPWVLVVSERPTRRSRIIAEHPVALINAATQELSQEEHNKGPTPCSV